MDPQACFRLFLDAVDSGDTFEAYEHADNYNSAMRRGMFPADDDNEEPIVCLDAEQDRYGIGRVVGGQIMVERWRNAYARETV